MTREQAINQAVNAARKAQALAVDAENSAHGSGRGTASGFAAAGRTWAEASRAYAALAELLPETEAARG